MKKKITKEPKQKRSLATKNRIKTTAKKLFSEEGYYAVTSNHIAEKANVPIGSFYNYFGNKKGLLIELIDDFTKQYHLDAIQQFDEAVKMITSKEMAIQVINILVRSTISTPSLQDPFFKVVHSLQFTDKDVLDISEGVRRLEINTLVKFLETFQQFHPQKNIPTKARLIHSSVENVALYINQLGINCDKEQLIEETIAMVYRYLFGKE